MKRKSKREDLHRHANLRLNQRSNYKPRLLNLVKIEPSEFLNRVQSFMIVAMIWITLERPKRYMELLVPEIKYKKRKDLDQEQVSILPPNLWKTWARQV
jgi:hypothetical protein